MPLADARLVTSALAAVLGLAIRSDNPLASLIASLRIKEMLLVLDNCEKLIATSAAKPTGRLPLLSPPMDGSPQFTGIYPTSLDCCAMRCNVIGLVHHIVSAQYPRRGTMSTLRFDPVTNQFYYRRSRENSAPAKAAGFGWDPIRCRY